MQLLPHGVPHSVRVPAGTARIMQVSIRSPYDGFARDMARHFAAGASMAQIVEAAGRHGVQLGLARLDRCRLGRAELASLRVGPSNCVVVDSDRGVCLDEPPGLTLAVKDGTRMTTMVTPADFGLSPWHFRIRGRHEMVELTPSLCPNGHRFENGSYLTGSSPCVACTGSSHRISGCASQFGVPPAGSGRHARTEPICRSGTGSPRRHGDGPRARTRGRPRRVWPVDTLTPLY